MSYTWNVNISRYILRDFHVWRFCNMTWTWMWRFSRWKNWTWTWREAQNSTFTSRFTFIQVSRIPPWYFFVDRPLHLFQYQLWQHLYGRWQSTCLWSKEYVRRKNPKVSDTPMAHLLWLPPSVALSLSHPSHMKKGSGNTTNFTPAQTCKYDRECGTQSLCAEAHRLERLRSYM